VNGDGHADVIAAAGPGGGPQVTVFDGKSLNFLTAFYALPQFFTGGLYVTVGDLDGDGRAEIIAGAEKGGGPQVTIFNGTDGSLRASFFALPQFFTGGVRVGYEGTSINGRPGILAAAGPGAGPQVTAFDGVTFTALDSFFAFPTSFTSGLFV